MVDVHAQMIEEREAKLEKLKAQVDVLTAEIKVLKEAQSLVQTGEPPKKKKRTKRDRPLNEKWVDVLTFISVSGEASLDEIKQHVDRKGLSISNGSLRSQLAGYANKGWVERSSPGVFFLTEAGAEKIGLDIQNEAPTGATEGASISGGGMPPTFEQNDDEESEIPF